MLTTTAEQLARYANDVAVLWDEAQDNPALLRFLSPFGRPDLGRLTRRFGSAGSVLELIEEGYPVFATWLATMMLRDGLHPGAKLKALSDPKWGSAMITPALELDTAVQLGGGQLRTLVVAGSLKAPVVRVLDARLVVAGDLEAQLLVADGCVLVGGSIKADIVVCPGSRLSKPEAERLPRHPSLPLGWQVGHEVQCRIFDSPRFGLSCPVKAEVVVRGVGLSVTPQAHRRLQALLVAEVLTRGALNLEAIVRRISRGERLFT